MHRKNAQLDEMQRELQDKNDELQNETPILQRKIKGKTNTRFPSAFNPPPPPPNQEPSPPLQFHTATVRRHI